MTFAEQLGAAKHEAREDDGVSSKNEAKKLPMSIDWRTGISDHYVTLTDKEYGLCAGDLRGAAGSCQT